MHPAETIPPEAAAMLPWLARPFLRLKKPEDVKLVCSMLRGEWLRDIAKRWGTSIQTIHLRWKRIIKADPAWRSIASGMIGRGRGRKPAKAEERRG